MKLRLFNLTDKTILVTSECLEHAAGLSVLPNASAELPAEDNFKLSSIGASPENILEKVLLELEVGRQHSVNPKKRCPFGLSHISMPEDCPWRIYRDQVTSLILLRLSVKCL
jgi:hypothetical protein